jgi:hypothetical protein
VLVLERRQPDLGLRRDGMWRIRKRRLGKRHFGKRRLRKRVLLERGARQAGEPAQLPAAGQRFKRLQSIASGNSG